MQFLDAGTARHLGGFEEIWSRIKPVSSLGRALHRKAQPFSPEQKKRDGSGMGAAGEDCGSV